MIDTDRGRVALFMIVSLDTKDPIVFMICMAKPHNDVASSMMTVWIQKILSYLLNVSP